VHVRVSECVCVITLIPFIHTWLIPIAFDVFFSPSAAARAVGAASAAGVATRVAGATGVGAGFEVIHVSTSSSTALFRGFTGLFGSFTGFFCTTADSASNMSRWANLCSSIESFLCEGRWSYPRAIMSEYVCVGVWVGVCVRVCRVGLSRHVCVCVWVGVCECVCRVDLSVVRVCVCVCECVSVCVGGVVGTGSIHRAEVSRVSRPDSLDERSDSSPTAPARQ